MTEIASTTDGRVTNSPEQSPAQALSQYVGGLLSRMTNRDKSSGTATGELDFPGADYGSSTARPLGYKPCSDFDQLPINEKASFAATTVDANGKPIHTFNLVLDTPSVVSDKAGNLYFAQKGSAQFSVTDNPRTQEINLTNMKGVQGTLPEDKNQGLMGWINKGVNTVAGKTEIESARFVHEKGRTAEQDRYSLILTGVLANESAVTKKLTKDFPQALTKKQFDDLHTQISSYLGDKVASR